jgi:2-keto-3-deoxy-L-arabinonate dehydratase
VSQLLELRGCIPILCTPFEDDGSIDFQSLKREIDWVISEGATGVSTLALASEGYKLTDVERDQMVTTVVDHVAGRVPVVVSADGAGTVVAVDRAIRAERLGASALMVLPPYLVKPNLDGLYHYYRGIAEAVRIPVMIQDAPQLTGVHMGPQLWAKLARETPGIRYVKAEGTPQGETISESIRLSEGQLGVFCGWGGLGIIDALDRSAIGSMPAPNFTRLFAEIQVAYEGGMKSEARRLLAGGLPFAVWAMQSLDHSVAAAKEELKRRGVFTTAVLREPAARLDRIALAQLAEWIDEKILAQGLSQTQLG